MGNSKAKMTVPTEEGAVGKEIQDVKADDKATEGAPAEVAATEATEPKLESATNGHATATGEEPAVVVVVEDAEKSKEDTIEECPATPADTTAADTTTDSAATPDSATKKKRGGKPLVWLKQVKKHVSFNRKKKPVVEKKAQEEAGENGDAGAVDDAAKDTAEEPAETAEAPKENKEEPKAAEDAPAPVTESEAPAANTEESAPAAQESEAAAQESVAAETAAE